MFLLLFCYLFSSIIFVIVISILLGFVPLAASFKDGEFHLSDVITTMPTINIIYVYIDIDIYNDYIKVNNKQIIFHEMQTLISRFF